MPLADEFYDDDDYDDAILENEIQPDAEAKDDVKIETRANKNKQPPKLKVSVPNNEEEILNKNDPEMAKILKKNVQNEAILRDIERLNDESMIQNVNENLISDDFDEGLQSLSDGPLGRRVRFSE